MARGEQAVAWAQRHAAAIAKTKTVHANRLHTLAAETARRFETSARTGDASAGSMRLDPSVVTEEMDRVVLTDWLFVAFPGILDDFSLSLTAYRLHGITAIASRGMLLITSCL